MKRSNRRLLVVLLATLSGVVAIGALLGWLAYNRVRPLEVAASFGGFHDNESIHGFGVLTQMLRQQGHQVARTGMLTSQVDRYDLLIWTHKGPQLPNDEALEKLEEWMDNGGMVVFIGHDYDATLDYWRSVYAESQGSQREVARWAYRQEQLKSLGAPLDMWEELFTPALRRDYQADAANRWMTIGGTDQPKPGHWEPSGTDDTWQQVGPKFDPFAIDLDAGGRLPIHVRTWLVSKSKNAQVLATVRTQGEVIPTMWRETQRAGSGRQARDLLVISHPVFLGNFGILRPENASLRETFLAEISGKERVLFLETGPGPVQLSTTPNDRIDQAWAWMTKGPFPVFALHAVLLAAVFCFARFPVFGRPRRIDFEPRNDFGQHIAEVGRLLRSQKLETFAREKLEHYYQVARRGPRNKPS
ncbi:MAG: hypothetical protein JNK57_04350 [Planctomycetaceae bacterium]|jgi:hypothetical protein|nr:hypothetical protein [Planctomycetaceae bacterium]